MFERVERYLALKRQRAAAHPAAAGKPAQEAMPAAQRAACADAAPANRWSPVGEENLSAKGAALLVQWGDQRRGEKWNLAMTELRQSVAQSIAGPFGLGQLARAADQHGGAVDTVHNVRAGVYANADEARRYDERGAYDPRLFHQHPDYIVSNKKMMDSLEAGTLRDTYTGILFTRADGNDTRLKPHQDHIQAAKRVFDDRGRVLAERDAPTLANIDANLSPTSATINCSFKADTAQRNLQRLAAAQADRRAAIAALEQQAGALTDKQRTCLIRMKKLEQVDAGRVLAAVAKAKAAIEASINQGYYRSGKFLRSCAGAGVAQGARMGMQQALGLALSEFFAAVLDEVSDLCRQGMQQDGYLHEAGVRLRRIAARVAGKWKEALRGFGAGFLSGLLSSLATTLINAFLTTGKRAVRMVREGGHSLFRAGKLLAFHPEGMSGGEALHAASKIIAAGALVGAGIVLEEVIGKYLLVLGPLASSATAVIVGAITAIATALAALALDRIDLFGAEQLSCNRDIDAQLDAHIAATSRQLDARPARLNTGTAAG